MFKPIITTREFIDGVNQHISENAKKNPAELTFTCTECGQIYVAENTADFFVCPHCGRLQQDEEDFEEEE